MERAWHGTRCQTSQSKAANVRAPGCFPRCLRAHTVVKAFRVHGFHAAESTGRSTTVDRKKACSCMLNRRLFSAASSGAKKKKTAPCSATRRSDCRSLEQDVHAMRTRASRIHETPTMHAPQEGIVFEHCPLHSLQRGTGRTRRAFDRSPRSSVVELLNLRRTWRW